MSRTRYIESRDALPDPVVSYDRGLVTLRMYHNLDHTVVIDMTLKQAALVAEKLKNAGPEGPEQGD